MYLFFKENKSAGNPVYRNMEAHLIFNEISNVPCIRLLIDKDEIFALAKMFSDAGYCTELFGIGIKNYKRESGGNSIVAFSRFCDDVFFLDKDGHQDCYVPCLKLMEFAETVSDNSADTTTMQQKKHIYDFAKALVKSDL